jgi:hypothetical protein
MNELMEQGLLGKLILLSWSKNTPPFMRPEGPLWHSKNLALGAILSLFEPVHNLTSYMFYDPF